MLTSDTDTPVVTKTTVTSDSLQALDILTELVVQAVRGDLAVLAVLVVLLSVQEPVGDLVLTWVGNNGHNSVDLD